MAPQRVLWLCIAFRLLNALCTGASVFNPDEYWQSMEVAYALVWSGGFIPWEYQSHAQIRGILHPAIFAALYWLLRAIAPRLLQALFAGVGDYSLYLLALRLFGKSGAKWTLFCSLINWFMFYCITRTLSNSLECSLTMVALQLWPDTSGYAYPPVASSPVASALLKQYERRRRWALILAAIVFVVRPTSAVLWLLLGSYHVVVSLPSWSSRLRLLWREVLPIALVTLAASVAADALFYNRHLLREQGWAGLLHALQANPRAFLPVVSLNFLRLNSGSDLAALYGTHPWHWYWSEGLPTNLGPLTPFFLWALARFLREGSAPADSTVPPAEEVGEGGGHVASPCQSRRSMLLLLATLGWSMAAFSCNAHKELRFILPVTPVAFLLVGRWMAGLERGEAKQDKEDRGTGTSVSDQSPESVNEHLSATQGMRLRRKGAELSSAAAATAAFAAAAAAAVAPAASPSRPPLSRRPLKLVVGFLLVSNVLMGGYLTFVHQSGPARVFALLRGMQAKWVQRPCLAGSDSASCSQAQPLRVHFLLNCHTMPFYSHMHVPQQQGGEGLPRSVDLHFLDCSPLFINGSLHGNGSNPCSASAQFARDPARFIDEYYTETTHERGASAADFGRTGSNPGRADDAEWPWYRSAAYASCMHERLGLASAQVSLINNEKPGGGMVALARGSEPRAQGAASRAPPLPHVVVLDEAKSGALNAFLSRHGFELVESVFHSHLDDTKRFLVYARELQSDPEK